VSPVEREETGKTFNAVITLKGNTTALVGTNVTAIVSAVFVTERDAEQSTSTLLTSPESMGPKLLKYFCL